MCGFVGMVSNQTKLDSSLYVMNMVKTISHRGPDNAGHFGFTKKNVFFAHQRLAILDLSDLSNQPFLSDDKKQVLCFNGEIYNHLSLRTKFLSQHNINFKTNSDTETLFYLIFFHGIEKTLQLIDGMFVLSYYNSTNNELFIARDRFGEKPLMYSFSKNYLVFASELKALKELPFVDYTIDIDSVEMFKDYGYISAPNTIYKSIKKLQPAELICFNLEKDITIKYKVKFFNLNVYKKNHDFCNDNSQINLESILNASVKSRLLSDVPVGSFLSGGIDSSLITYFAQKNSINKINTFTIGFAENEFNEADYAKDIAGFIGTNHHELYVKSSDILPLISQMPIIYDEPFADPSQLPFLILSKFASNYNKVCLSGDGGDELFSGYDRYRYLPILWNIFKKLPLQFRHKLSNLIKIIDLNGLNILFFGHSHQIHRLAKFIKASSFPELFESARSYPNSVLYSSFQDNIELSQNDNNYINQYMRTLDLNSFLPDDVLTKVDIASMRYSLEVRSPFLNESILNYASSLSSKNLMTKKTGKLPLRLLLSKYIPQGLHNRKKSGFSVPIAAWLRGDLKHWANDLIYDPGTNIDEFYDRSYIKKIWKSHYQGKYDFRLELWNYLTFQNWLLNIKN